MLDLLLLYLLSYRTRQVIRYLLVSIGVWLSIWMYSTRILGLDYKIEMFGDVAAIKVY